MCVEWQIQIFWKIPLKDLKTQTRKYIPIQGNVPLTTDWSEQTYSVCVDGALPAVHGRLNEVKNVHYSLTKVTHHNQTYNLSLRQKSHCNCNLFQIRADPNTG
jgi:hypothetical protein